MPERQNPLGSKRGTRWVPRLLLLALSVGFGLLAAEGTLRLLAPQTVRYWQPANPYEAEGEGGYRLRPGYHGTLANRTEFQTRVSINRLGLRGPEVADGPTRRCRVLALGDSFTFGMGVEHEESYIARLEAELEARGVSIEGLNGGTPGLGAPQEVRWLERHSELSPDLVVLGFFVGNDLQDATRQWGTWEVVGGRATPAGTYARLRDWLYFHSHLYVLLKQNLPHGIQRPVRALLGWDEPWTLRSARAGFEIYAPEGSDLMQEAIAATAAALDRLQELARQRSFRLTALVIPDEAQVDAERWRATVEALGLSTRQLEPEYPNRVLGRILADRSIPALDLLDPLRVAHDRGERLYWPEDRHWTAAGHAVAARELADFLTERDLLCSATAASGH